MALDHDKATGRFLPGGNAYAARKAAKEAIRVSLEAEYDFSRPAHAVLLTTIVLNIFDSSRLRKGKDRVRAANVARRLLRDIPKRQALLDGLLP